MFIIFGQCEHVETRDTGTFFCPVCHGWQSYAYRVRRAWFTLFFIRTGLPTSAPVEYVECLSCGNTFDITALRYNPGDRSA